MSRDFLNFYHFAFIFLAEVFEERYCLSLGELALFIEFIFHNIQCFIHRDFAIPTLPKIIDYVQSKFVTTAEVIFLAGNA